MMTNDEWAKRWAQAMPLNHRNEALVALRDDHHEAREEVRRLRADGAASEVRTERLRARVRVAVEFLEERFGNAEGHDWADEAAAHVADVLEGNVDP